MPSVGLKDARVHDAQNVLRPVAPYHTLAIPRPLPFVERPHPDHNSDARVGRVSHSTRCTKFHGVPSNQTSQQCFFEPKLASKNFFWPSLHTLLRKTLHPFSIDFTQRRSCCICDAKYDFLPRAAKRSQNEHLNATIDMFIQEASAH